MTKRYKQDYDFIKNRKEWKEESGKRVEGMPSVTRARDEYEAAVRAGDMERVLKAIKGLEEAVEYQSKRLR